MHDCQNLPFVWLLSDQRNDQGLEKALHRLPEGSAFVYRHYHLDNAAREKRFRALAAIARSKKHVVILSGDSKLARSWGADGIYGSAKTLERAASLYRIATAHDLAEIGAANRVRADAVMLSPVYSTRSHPGGATLGPVKFRLLARKAAMPVIALGGMTADRTKDLRWDRWAAIDGLS